MNNNMIEMIDPKVFGDGNRTFTRWQDTGDLKRRIVEMGEWHGFWMYAATEFKEVQHKAGKVVWRKSEMSNWLMNPIRFPELVAGWWWQERRVKG